MTSVHTTPAYNYQDYVPSEGITCPICGFACRSLQALNTHLDSTHTEEDSKGALISWLRNAQKKVQTTLSTSGRPGGSSSTTSTNAVERSLRQLIDPALVGSFTHLNLGNSNPDYFASDNDRQADHVTREHWQRETNNDVCSLAGCGKSLGRLGAIKQHCKRCGKLFCDRHMQYEIKLDRLAQHDPENGVWCRVCPGCYMNRPDYMDCAGPTRNITSVFIKKRDTVIDRVQLNSNRLEKRLEKLAWVHYKESGGRPDPKNKPNGSPRSPTGSLSMVKSESSSSRGSLGSLVSLSAARVSNGNSILSMKLKYRDGEQSVTRWEDDKAVHSCPLCGLQFSMTNRKHHCRLCGRVVCGSPRCSRMIPLFLHISSDNFEEEPVGDTRACCDCERAVFRRRIHYEETTRPLPIFQLYNQLARTRQNIEKQLPRFHDMMVMLEQDKAAHHTQEHYQMAAQIRKSLLDNFALYDTLAKSIKSLPLRTPMSRRLQSNICMAANLYLQQNMLPLQMLPRILKPEKKKKNHAQRQSISKTTHQKQKQDIRLELQAFQEQRGLVEGFIRDAQANRKYDDVKLLTQSLNELDDEIERLQQEYHAAP